MVRRMSVSFLIVVVFLAGIASVDAGEWRIIGPRALGMGGANVAVANDATASYWNPGAFGFFKGSEDDYYGKRTWSMTLAGIGVGTRLSGSIGEKIDKVSEIDFEGRLDDNDITTNEVSDFVGLLSAIEGFRGQDGLAATVTVNGSVLGLQVGHFGLGAQFFVDLTASPNFDFNNLGPDNTQGFSLNDFTNPSNLGCATCSTTAISVRTLSQAQAEDIDAQLRALGWNDAQRFGYINAFDNGLSQPGETAPSDDVVTEAVNAATLGNNAAGSGGPLSQNASRLRFKGIAVVEIPLTYGHAFSEKLSVGGNLKYMKARVYDVSVGILDQDFGDALDEALESHQEASNFGIDLGMLYRVGNSLRIGLVGRNLNSPKFAGIKEKAQLRGGLAYQVRDFIILAADLDLKKNDAGAGSDLSSQNIGAGIELNLLKVLKIRGGFYRNLAESDVGLVYTLGLGLNLWVVHLDVGVARSSDNTNLDGDSTPEEVRGEFALSMLF